MTLSQLNNRKSNHATWMLAVVVFLSGFAFSGYTEYAKADREKTRTEVVVDSKITRRKAVINPFAANTFPFADFHVSEISQVLRGHNRLIKIRFDSTKENYQTFSSDLILRSFSSKIPHNDFSSLIG